MMLGGDNKKNKIFMPFIGVGFELFFLMMGAFYLGGIVDEKFGLKGLGTILAIIIVFTSWIFHLTVLMKKVKKNLELEDSADDN